MEKSEKIIKLLKCEGFTFKDEGLFEFVVLMTLNRFDVATSEAVLDGVIKSEKKMKKHREKYSSFMMKLSVLSGLALTYFVEHDVENRQLLGLKISKIISEVYIEKHDEN